MEEAYACEVQEVFRFAIQYPAFWIFAGIVGLLAFNRFSDHAIEGTPLAPEIGLTNRSYTTAFRYNAAAFFYSVTFVALYFLLVFVTSVPVLSQYAFELLRNLAPGGLAYDAFVQLDPGAAAGVRSVETGEWFGLCSKTEESHAFQLVPQVAENRIFYVLVLAFAGLGLLLAVPRVAGPRGYDRRFREFLHRTASVPDKARMVGRLIMRGLQPDADRLSAAITIPEGTPVPFTASPATFRALLNLVTRLLNEAATSGRSARLADFLARRQNYIRKLEGRFHLLQKQSQSDLKPLAHEYLAEIAELNDRLATLIACGVLESYATEYRVSRFLRDDLRLAHVVVPTFRFEFLQVVLSVVGLTASVVLGWVLWTLFVNTDPAFGLTDAVTWGFRFSMATVPFFLFPVMVAWFVSARLLDLRVLGTTGEGVGGYAGRMALSFFIGFAGSWMILAGRFAMIGLETSVAELTIWTVPVATFAMLYLALARFLTYPSIVFSAVMQFVVFGALTYFLYDYAVDLVLAVDPGSEDRTVAATGRQLPTGSMESGFPYIFGFVGGSFAALLSLIAGPMRRSSGGEPLFPHMGPIVEARPANPRP